MFAGKSEETDRLVRRARVARRRAVSFTPVQDDRYAIRRTTHAGRAYESSIVSSSEEITSTVLSLAETPHLIAVDEAQFFDRELARRLREIADMGITVVAAGLNRDAQGIAWPVMAELLSDADEITVLFAICQNCAEKATWTRRKSTDLTRVVTGGAELYEALCRRCWLLARP
jgi:thymidine kinase